LVSRLEITSNLLDIPFSAKRGALVLQATIQRLCILVGGASVTPLDAVRSRCSFDYVIFYYHKQQLAKSRPTEKERESEDDLCFHNLF